MDGVHIRKAEQADAYGIAKVKVETWQSAYADQLPAEYLNRLSIKEHRERWKQHLSTSAPNRANFVAVEDGKIIGFCGVGPNREPDAPQDEGELYTIYVQTDRAGKGVGARIMEAGLQFLKEHGFKEAILWVLKTNKKTIAFYEKKGWVFDHKEKTETKEGAVFDDVKYRIKLS